MTAHGQPATPPRVVLTPTPSGWIGLLQEEGLAGRRATPDEARAAVLDTLALVRRLAANWPRREVPV